MSWAIEEKGYSQRHAYGLIGLEPKTYRYASTRGDDAAVRVTSAPSTCSSGCSACSFGSPRSNGRCSVLPNSPAMRTSSSPLPGVTWRIRLISPTWKIATNGSA